MAGGAQLSAALEIDLGMVGSGPEQSRHNVAQVVNNWLVSSVGHWCS